jgi:hypothetical protein
MWCYDKILVHTTIYGIMIYETQKFKHPNVQFYGLDIDCDIRILIYQMPDIHSP